MTRLMNWRKIELLNEDKFNLCRFQRNRGNPAPDHTLQYRQTSFSSLWPHATYPYSETFWYFLHLKITYKLKWIIFIPFDSTSLTNSCDWLLALRAVASQWVPGLCRNGPRISPIFDKSKVKYRVYVDLYSALRKAPLMRSDMDHTVLPANYTMPAFTPQPQSITALWLVLILPSHGG